MSRLADAEPGGSEISEDIDMPLLDAARQGSTKVPPRLPPDNKPGASMTQHRRTAIAAAVATFFTLTLAPHVSSAAVDDQDAQRVVVTGSNIKRLDAET